MKDKDIQEGIGLYVTVIGTACLIALILGIMNI